MKRGIQFILPLLLVISVSAFCQKDVENGAGWKDRIFTGGGGGLGGGTDQFGNKYFNISISPVIGYMVTSNLSTGVSFIYQNTNYSDLGIHYKQYGVMPFIRYNFDQFFLITEFNYLNIPILNSNYDTVDRIYRFRWLAGAGYSVPLGGRSKLNAVAMYDLVYNRQYFLSPWVFRVFFSF